MARTEGSWGQATHVLKVITDAEPSKDQINGLVENSDLIKGLIRHGDSLSAVDRHAFEVVLKPAGDFWATKRVNPFKDEYDEPSKNGNVSNLMCSSNHLTYSASCYERAFGPLDSSEVVKKEKSKPFGESYELPHGAEDLTVWPKLSKIGEILGVPDPYCLDYGYCLRYVIRQVSQYRKVDIGKVTQGLNAVQLQLLPCVSRFYRDWEAKTKGDYNIAALQLGALYAGYSARNARYEMIKNGQFPLDPYVVACLLLANNSLLYLDDTHIDCPGAEYARSPGDSRDFILTFENSNVSPVMHLFHEGAHPGGIRQASGFMPRGMKLIL